MITEMVKQLFTPTEDAPLEVDVNIRWDHHPAYRELDDKCREAMATLATAQERPNWCENVLDPHRSHMRTSQPDELEVAEANAQRSEIRIAFAKAKAMVAKLSQQRDAVGRRIHSEIFAQRNRSDERKRLARNFHRALQPVVEANMELHDYEAQTEANSGMELRADCRLSWRN